MCQTSTHCIRAFPAIRGLALARNNFHNCRNKLNPALENEREHFTGYTIAQQLNRSFLLSKYPRWHQDMRRNSSIDQISLFVCTNLVDLVYEDLKCENLERLNIKM